MAHNDEPMDIDNIESDFDNKENNFHHNNVYPRTPCTEKGYEELDVSELNMKLRYSCTPASSPMSKSFTANCVENKNYETSDESLNGNLTRSFNSSITKSDILNKSVKTLPLQELTSEKLVDNSRNASVLRMLDTAVVTDTNNITVTVTGSNDVDENILVPSPSSSTTQTPEAATPTKDFPRNDGGSPIMRGLKSVLNMFRSSQSPIPNIEDNDSTPKQVFSPAEIVLKNPSSKPTSTAVLASTPIAAHKLRESSISKRNSPLKESIVFNEDLEKELLWKDETTILFSEEKIPIHKLFPTAGVSKMGELEKPRSDNINTTVEYMDISCNDSIAGDKTISYVAESDGEFVDCETTFTDDKPSTDKNKESKINATLENTHIQESNIDNINSYTDLNLESLVPKPLNTTRILGINDSESVSYNIPIGNSNGDQVAVEVLNIKNEESFKSQDISSNTNDDAHKHVNVSEVPSHILVIKGIIEHDVSLVKLEEAVNADIINKNVVESTDKIPTFEAETNIIEKQVSANDLGGKPDEYSVEGVLGNSHESTEDKIILTETSIQSEEVENDKETSLELSSTACIDPCQMNKTCVHENNDVSNTKNTVKMSTESFILKENLQNNSTIQQGNINTTIENVASTSTYTIDIQKEASNIPLPDEDDIENDKSLGVCIFETEATMPIDINKNINNMSINTDLESSDNIEHLPTETMIPANLPSENKLINDTFNKENSSIIQDQNNTETNQQLEVIHTIKDILIPENNESIKNMETIVEETKCSTQDDLPNKNKLINDTYNKENPRIIEDQNNDEINKPLEVTHAIKAIKPIESIVEETKFGTQDNNIQLNFSTTPGMSQQKDIIIRQNIETTELDPVEEIKPDLLFQSTTGIQNYLNKSQLTNLDEHLTTTETMNTVDKLNGTTMTAEIIIEKEGKKTIVNNMPTEINTNNERIKSEEEQCENSIKELISDVNSDNTNTNVNIAKMNITSEEASLNMILKTTDAGISKNTNIISEQIEANLNTNELSADEKSSDTLSTVVQINTEDISNEHQMTDDRINKDEIEENVDEEIIISENNSPYVSVAAGIDTRSDEPVNFDEIYNPITMKNEMPASPPKSPKIVSKGYNFNFDEIDNPFATKTKIRMSPTPESPKESILAKTHEKPVHKDTNKNRRKSQPERKKIVPKKRLNSTFSGPTTANEDKPIGCESNKGNKQPHPNNFEALAESGVDKLQDIIVPDGKIEIEDLPKVSADISNSPSCAPEVTEVVTTSDIINNENDITEAEIKDGAALEINEVVSTSCVVNNIDHNLQSEIKEVKLNKNEEIDENKIMVESIVSSHDIKTTSSSEQSTYYSAATSSSDSFKTKNVFNIPEIDDMNFNPFATKTKICKSPSPDFEDTVNKKLDNSDSKATPTLEDNECSIVSSTTCSSKATDERDITIREANTEDEDTIEGPFLDTDDLKNDDKMSDFDGDDVDMMQFSELPTQENEDGGELFIDAEAFEFLLNQNQANVVSNSGKESLFLKFDPLFAKRVSTDGVLAALNKVQKRQSTPKKMNSSTSQQIDLTFEKSLAEPSSSTLNKTREDPIITTGECIEDPNVTVSKPMMVVTPAFNPVVNPRNKSTTPTSSNRRSLTFTSPAIAVIDRLLSLSGNNSMIGLDTTVTQASREQNEADLALTQLRELLAEKEISVYNLRTESKELKNRLSTMESQMRVLEAEGEERLKKVNDLNDKLTEKTKLNKSMAAVVEEYERTIASLIAETEQDKKRNNEERMKLIKERDEQTAHLASMEVSFSDLHSKYEKSKQIILTCKANEDSYKKSIKEFEENLAKMQSNYELLKQHATSKLNHANQELEKMNRSHEAEVLKLNAMIKRKELHITSLEETLAQKTKANEELTAICDELINKVG